MKSWLLAGRSREAVLNRTHKIVGTLLMAAFAVVNAFAQSDNDPPMENVEVFRQLAASIGQNIAAQIPPLDSGYVLVTPFAGGAAYAVNKGLHSTLGPHDSLGTGRCTRECEFVMNKIGIRYSDPHRSGLFGTRLLVRNATLTLAVRMSDVNPRKLLLEREFQAERRDTVALSMIETLENPAIPETHGTLPEAGLFSTLAEPLIMLGAIGVAVFLLFKIRS